VNNIDKLQLEIRDTDGEIEEFEIYIEDFRIRPDEKVVIIGIGSGEAHELYQFLKKYFNGE